MSLEQEMEEADAFIFAAMKAREASIYRAIEDVHGVSLEDLVAPAGSPQSLWEPFNEMMVSLIGDLSLCAQDVGVLVWLEVVNFMESNPGVHFSVPDEEE